MGLSKDLSSRFDRLVASWLNHSGPAWTVQRLKDLKLDLIRLRAGLEPLAWVRKNRKGGWYGVLGSLRKLSQTPKGFKVACNCFMAASAFKPGEPTEKHIAAMRQNLGAVPVHLSFVLPTSLRVPKLGEADSDSSYHKVCSEVLPLFLNAGKPGKKSPVAYGRSTPQDRDFHLELRAFDDSAFWNHFVKFRPFYEPIVAGLVGDIAPIAPKNIPTPCGHLVPLDKDGSWKIRWIASPLRIHQWALKPFADRLFALLQQQPWDYTFRQDQAIPKLQGVLAEGHVCHSVDLSSATDHFPLDLQVSVLRQLNSQPLWQRAVDLFVDLSRGKWYYKKEAFQWSKGQPMGLRASFPAFALTHGLLLHHISNGADVFAILGDDVVIWDTSVYKRYVQLMQEWQVPISSHKTLSSDKLCEFAGAIISCDQVFRCYKWKDIDDENFLQQMIQFGKRFRNRLTPRQRRLYDKVADLQPPIGCAHGVEDVSLSVLRTERLLDSGKEVRGSHTLGFFEWCKKHSRLMNMYSIKRVRSMQATFDKKVVEAIRRLPFMRMKEPVCGNMQVWAESLAAVRCEPNTPYLCETQDCTLTQLQLLEQLVRNGRAALQRSSVPVLAKADMSFLGWQIFYEPDA
jgi:hypothetical protein